MIYKLNNFIDIKQLMISIGTDKSGIEIMSKKSKIEFFLIKNISCGAANILKQDALSIGAEVVTPSGAINCSLEMVDVILMCNQKELEILARKELAQPFGLKNIAKELSNYIKPKKFPIQIMGVLNINSDSFYEKSRTSISDFRDRFTKMVEDGANIIDIGAVSSRPNSVEVSEQDEFDRIKPIIDELYLFGAYNMVELSLDSYRYNIIKYALDRGFKIINDITGLRDENIAKLANEYRSKLVIMHMQNNPSTMQINPYYEDVVSEIDSFFADKISKAKSFGVEDIILDVGIGFGKRLIDNISLISNISTFTKYKLPILIGASRKSMIDNISPSTVENRLGGTIAIHLRAIENGANIIRCHDVFEHYQAIKVLDLIDNYK